MKKMGFIVIYLCLGVVALIVRISLSSDSEVEKYMSIINQIAGFATIIMILYNVLMAIINKVKKDERSMKRLIPFCSFSIFVIMIYWFSVKGVYQEYPITLLNDMVTICSLTIALTNDLYEGFLIAIFYRE